MIFPAISGRRGSAAWHQQMPVFLSPMSFQVSFTTCLSRKNLQKSRHEDLKLQCPFWEVLDAHLWLQFKSEYIKRVNMCDAFVNWHSKNTDDRYTFVFWICRKIISFKFVSYPRMQISTCKIKTWSLMFSRWGCECTFQCIGITYFNKFQN